MKQQIFLQNLKRVGAPYFLSESAGSEHATTTSSSSSSPRSFRDHVIGRLALRKTLNSSCVGSSESGR